MAFAFLFGETSKVMARIKTFVGIMYLFLEMPLSREGKL